MFRTLTIETALWDTHLLDALPKYSFFGIWGHAEAAPSRFSRSPLSPFFGDIVPRAALTLGSDLRGAPLGAAASAPSGAKWGRGGVVRGDLIVPRLFLHPWLTPSPYPHIWWIYQPCSLVHAQGQVLRMGGHFVPSIWGYCLRTSSPFAGSYSFWARFEKRIRQPDILIMKE
jgi:hypothetical protein